MVTDWCERVDIDIKRKIKNKFRVVNLIKFHKSIDMSYICFYPYATICMRKVEMIGILNVMNGQVRLS